MGDLGRDLLGRGLYSMPEAARLTGISAGRLYRWLRGYSYAQSGRRLKSDRILIGELPVLEDQWALSFRDLQEARALDEFRKRGLSWKRLRDLHQKARVRFRTDHPFSLKNFATVGRELFLDEPDSPPMDFARDQFSFRQVLEPYLKGLRFVGHIPSQWFPLEGSQRVVIDPNRSFGAPVAGRRGVRTAILAASHRAERSYDRVAKWYEIPVADVRAAVAYERQLDRRRLAA